MKCNIILSNNVFFYSFAVRIGSKVKSARKLFTSSVGKTECISKQKMDHPSVGDRNTLVETKQVNEQYVSVCSLLIAQL